jgi:hypothetical protein
MASRLVHAVHSLIAFGHPYEYVHAKKDRFSQRRPGSAHRAVRHRVYGRLGPTWDFPDAYTECWSRSIRRIASSKGGGRAEECPISAAHDVDDRVWDFDDRSKEERARVRKYWEGLCAWLVLNPEVLKTWAGVDIVEGRIHRVMDGVEVWDREPSLPAAYASLRRHVEYLLRVDRKLRDAVIAGGSAAV